MLALLPQEQQDRIKHVSIDLTSQPHEVAASLNDAGVQAEYLFFYGYNHPVGLSTMDRKMANAPTEANVPIFRNLFVALAPANIKPAACSPPD